MIKFYRGPWQWVTEGGMSFWAPPAGFNGLDLRTISQQSQQGGSPGLGIFVGNGNPGSDYDLLGSGNWYEVKATQKLRDSLPAPRGYSPKGPDLCGLVWDLLTDGSDPDGTTGPKPIMPTTEGRLELHFGQSHYERFRWGGPETPKIKRMLRKEFAQLIQDVQDGKMRAKQHLRVMDYWCEKYKVDDWREFVPDAIQKDVPGREPHETTINDTFNRANAGSLGTSSDGTWSWSNVTGTWNILSNQAIPATGGVDNVARADQDLSSADHYSQLSVVAVSSTYNVAPAVRSASAADTGYYFILKNQATTTYRNFKRVAGAFTSLASVDATFASMPFTAKLSVNGSALSAYVSGALTVGPTTDTSITGNLRTGMYTNSSLGGQIVDDYQAADLAASGLLYTQLERSTRGVLRGMYTKY